MGNHVKASLGKFKFYLIKVREVKDLAAAACKILTQINAHGRNNFTQIIMSVH